MDIYRLRFELYQAQRLRSAINGLATNALLFIVGNVGMFKYVSEGSSPILWLVFIFQGAFFILFNALEILRLRKYSMGSIENKIQSEIDIQGECLNLSDVQTENLKKEIHLLVQEHQNAENKKQLKRLGPNEGRNSR